VTAPEEDVMTEPTDSAVEAESTDPAEAVAAVETPAEVAATPAPAAPVATKTRVSGKIAKGGTHLAQTVGRRKEAIVRVRLMPGTGVFTLNGRTLESYFPNKVHQQLVREPFVVAEKAEQYDIIANLRGGGITGQAGALRLAVSRALIEVEPDDRPALKKAGFLTRDARVTESKKYGLKKARKAPQYSKR
jgi:small subunit ribosomal protein S9